MSNDVQVYSNLGGVSTRFGGVAPQNDLGAGISTGFPVMGFKGKVWSLRYGGNQIQIMRPDGDGPANSIEVVILGASKFVAKTYYGSQYSEGSDDAPDCASIDGVLPDPGVPHRQAQTCAICPHNAWGSRVTPDGKQAKACADNKRLAIVPLANLRNEAFGGPILLRVPPASLSELAGFGNKLQSLGIPFYAIATKIVFDTTVSYPKFLFTPMRALTDAEADVVLELMHVPQIIQITTQGQQGERPVAPATQAPVATTQAPVAQAPAPQPAPAPVAAQPAPQPAQQPTQSPFGGPAQGAPAPAPVAAPQPTPQGNPFGGGSGSNGPAAPQPDTTPVNPPQGGMVFGGQPSPEVKADLFTNVPKGNGGGAQAAPQEIPPWASDNAGAEPEQQQSTGNDQFDQELDKLLS